MDCNIAKTAMNTLPTFKGICWDVTKAYGNFVRCYSMNRAFRKAVEISSRLPARHIQLVSHFHAKCRGQVSSVIVSPTIFYQMAPRAPYDGTSKCRMISTDRVMNSFFHFYLNSNCRMEWHLSAHTHSRLAVRPHHSRRLDYSHGSTHVP